MSQLFSFREFIRDDIPIVQLNCQCGVEDALCELSPSFGCNLLRWAVGGKNIIDYDADTLKRHDYTGTPVLFPSPNRVSGGKLNWNGRQYSYQSLHRPPYEHGLVHDTVWQYYEPVVYDDRVELAAWVNFSQGSALFEAFPFECRLKLTFTLYSISMSCRVEVDNNADEALPFGFALHPYFCKLCGEDGTKLQISASGIMEDNDQQLPTGKILAVGGTRYDLSNPVEVGALNIDNVYTNLTGTPAAILYETLGWKVVVEAPEAFPYIVLYTPVGQPFFCIENQTCSVNAYNLHAEGFIKEAGLIVLEPGGHFESLLRYRIIKSGC